MSAHTEATPVPRRINQRHEATQGIVTIGAITLALVMQSPAATLTLWDSY